MIVSKKLSIKTKCFKKFQTFFNLNKLVEKEQLKKSKLHKNLQNL